MIQKYTRDTDDEILEATYQYALDYVVRPPYPTREGIIETLKQSNHPKAKAANPDDFVDSSLIKSLEDAGFFQQIGLRKKVANPNHRFYLTTECCQRTVRKALRLLLDAESLSLQQSIYY